MVISARSKVWNIDAHTFVVDPSLFTSDFNWAGTVDYIGVSGALLVDLSSHLDVQRQQRQEILREIADLYASVPNGAGERWRKLERLLRELADVTAVISRLSRIFKAVKRELRRRQRDAERAMYCGLDFRKRAWFLLHGSHPPRSKRAFAVAFVGEMT